MTSAMTLAGDEHSMFVAAANNIVEIVPADRCSVALVQEDGDFALFALEQGVGAAPLGVRSAPDETILSAVTRADGAVNMRDVTAQHLFDRHVMASDPDAAPNASALLSAPLTVGGEVLGILNLVGYGAGVYDDQDALLLGQIALTLAAQLARWRLDAHLRSALAEKEASTRQLQEAKEAAEAANRAKGSFLANMSHELRTPLNAILGFAQIMARDVETTPTMRESLNVIGRSGEHLLGLINNILEVSKIEAGLATTQQQSFDFYSFLDEIEDLFLTRAIMKGLQFIVERGDAPRYLLGDRRKLRQIVINLIGNALKFTVAGHVTLRADLRGERLFFEIEDTGPGISEAEIERLFKPFVQTQDNTHEGTGLGLAISREFVRLLGGELSVRSKVGRGSTFVFDISGEAGDPEQIAQEPSERFVKRLAPGQKPYRILVVEDKWTNRHFLVKLLESVGFVVREAENGAEGVRVFKEWEPHLIWMDMRMPIMSGYEAANAIKSTTQGQATTIVALTASVFEEDRAIVLSSGCDDYLRKPVRQRELFETMQRHLGVEFIWAEPSPTGFQVEDHTSRPFASLSGVDDALLDALSDAASQADGELVEAVLQSLPEGLEGVQSSIMNKVRDFLFHEIIEMVDAVKAQG